MIRSWLKALRTTMHRARFWAGMTLMLAGIVGAAVATLGGGVA